MSQKQFILLADALRQNKPAFDANVAQGHDYPAGFEQGRTTQWYRIVEALADFCQSQNPRFSRELWLGYIDGRCGSKGGPR